MLPKAWTDMLRSIGLCQIYNERQHSIFSLVKYECAALMGVTIDNVWLVFVSLKKATGLRLHHTVIIQR